MSAPALGATYLGDERTEFVIWAPRAERVEVRVVAPSEWSVALERDERGYHRAVVEGVEPDARYLYRLDGEAERPDPASRLQPEGVHGPSQVTDPAFPWSDDSWTGLPVRDYILYELHVGTFTDEGTFEAVVPHLNGLVDLGVTAIELMPVAQFPGTRNWGYDGVYPYAAQASYGGPEGLKRLVDACHARGLAVVLDVVYNHLGPEGNYLSDFGPYFTDRYKTPWGAALNFDGAESDEVRRYFIENALYWTDDCRIDALRLDAVHAILDTSAVPFLEELADAVHERAEERGRRVHLIAESDANDPRTIRPPERGGLGMDAQWSDDFHHALHALATGERQGYYAGFGRLDELARAYREGFAYTGQYSGYRRRRHGRSPRDVPAERFVIYAQNHDQVGNRLEGDRLSALLSFEEQKLVAAVVLLSPYLPLLFMGEEYGETAPFPYFVSHTDPELVEAVREGRREEFAAFDWAGEPPDPQAEATFRSAKLDHRLRDEGTHRVLLGYYKELLRLRGTLPAHEGSGNERMEVQRYEREQALFVRRWSGQAEVAAVFHFGDGPDPLDLPLPAGTWQKRLDSAEEAWGGPGSGVPGTVESDGAVEAKLPPHSAVLFER